MSHNSFAGYKKDHVIFIQSTKNDFTSIAKKFITILVLY